MTFVEEYLAGKKELIRRIFEGGGVQFRGDSGSGLCPFHEDEHPSFSTNFEDSRWLCHGCGAKGDLVTFVEQVRGVSTGEAIAFLRAEAGTPPRVENPKPIPGPKHYSIRDADGVEVAEHVREEAAEGSKKFRWEREGSIGLRGIKTADLPLYGSELVAMWPPAEAVFLVEGEKATDALLDRGFHALGTVCGASTTPNQEVLKILAGRNVILWPDNDDAGRQHMARIGERLDTTAAELVCLTWGEEKGDDAFDYFARGGTADELKKLCAGLPPWTLGAHEIVPVRFEPTARSFPAVAWTGVLGKWRDLFAPHSEASLEFLWASFLVTAGLAFGRTVSVRNPIPLFPNFYVLLAGRTGDSHKSTVLYQARELLRAIRDDVEVISGVVSSEGIYERLSTREGTLALVYVDEFASLATVANRKGTSDIFPKLNTLYYCPREDTLDRRQNPTRIVEPFVSLIAAAPAAQLADLLSGSDVKSGTLNRYMVSSGESQKPKPRPPALNEEVFKTAAGLIKASVGKFQLDAVEMSFSNEAAELWDHFYYAWKSLREQEASELTARTHEHVLKIAMVYSALAGYREISGESMRIAIEIGGWLDSNANALFGDVGLDRGTKAGQKILAALRKAGGDARVRDIQQSLSRSVGSDFKRALDDLAASDLVSIEFRTTPGGQKEKRVKLMATRNTYLTGISGGKELAVVGTDPFALPLGLIAARSAGTGHAVEAYEGSGKSPGTAVCGYFCGLPANPCETCKQPFSKHASSGGTN